MTGEDADEKVVIPIHQCDVQERSILLHAWLHDAKDLT